MTPDYLTRHAAEVSKILALAKESSELRYPNRDSLTVTTFSPKLTEIDMDLIDALQALERLS